MRFQVITNVFVTRRFWVLLHRYAGLGITVFIILVGVTGSVLAFNSELERVVSPQLFAMPQPGVAPLDLAALAERAQALVPQARVGVVSFTEIGQATVVFIPRKDPTTGKLQDGVTGKSYDLGYTQLFLDPWTGEELGRRTRGDISEGLINLMPFIYKFHWTLAIGGVGQWTLGIVAVIWTLDCFNGFYLTLPISSTGFWQRWKLAWLIKRRASFYRLNFDLHRAGSLWLWPLLLIFAWSSVMFNIRPVYEWPMQLIFDYESRMTAFMSMPKYMNETPHLDWRAAQITGERLIAEQAAQHNFTAGQPLGLSYSPNLGAYTYEVRGSRDVFERAHKGGSTAIMFDGDTGALIKLHQPTGEHAGNTVESWLYALHMARVFGRPYQIFVCVLGVVIAMLSVTGVIIWQKKRKARRISKERRIQFEDEVNA